MKILKFLLIFILLVLPIGELLRFDIANNIVIKPIDVLVGFASFMLVILLVSKRKKLPSTRLTKPLILFSSISLISLIINSAGLQYSQWLTAFLYWIRFVSYAGIYYLVLYTDKDTFKKCKSLLLIAGSVFVILGYIQFFLYANLRNLYYLGWDEHNYRLFSTFLDPNFAGAFLVLFLLFLFARINISLDDKNNNILIRLGLLSIITIVAIFLTYSRSALLMLVISVTAYLYLLGKKKFLIIPITFTIVFLIVLSPTFNKENTNLLRTTSSLARLETYDNAHKIIYDHPYIGVGFNAYRYAQESYGFHPVESKFPDHGEAGTDNSFLFVTATTGVIGLLAYLYIWYSILKKAIFLYKGGNRSYPRIVIASAIGLFANSFFINSLFFPPIMLWMWIIVGLMERE